MCCWVLILELVELLVFLGIGFSIGVGVNLFVGWFFVVVFLGLGVFGGVCVGW